MREVRTHIATAEIVVYGTSSDVIAEEFAILRVDGTRCLEY